MKSRKINGVIFGSLLASISQAGGLENTAIPMAILYTDRHSEHENFILAGYGVATQNGEATYEDGTAGGSGGNVLVIPTINYRKTLSDSVSMLFAYYQPMSANSHYKKGSYDGFKVEVESRALSAVASWHINEQLEIHGGVTGAQMSINATYPDQLIYGEAIPDYAPGTFDSYDLKVNDTAGVGYIAGVSYAIPDIAFRARITYESSIDFKIKSKERVLNLDTFNVSNIENTTTTTMPEALTLALKSGLAENLLGWIDIRHVNWKGFEIAPVGYEALAGSPAESYDHDTTSYEIGLAAVATDKLTVGASLGYEENTGGESSPIGPGFGYKSAAVFAAYDVNNHLSLDVVLAQSISDAKPDGFGTKYKNIGNTYLGLGAGYSF